MSEDKFTVNIHGTGNGYYKYTVMKNGKDVLTKWWNPVGDRNVRWPVRADYKEYFNYLLIIKNIVAEPVEFDDYKSGEL